MFSQLTNFGLKRAGLQVLGFYLFYLLFGIIAGMLIGGVTGLLSGSKDEAYAEGVRIGTFVAIILSVSLSFLILNAKKLTGHIGYIALALASGILALIAGSLVGLIIPAYLTTKGVKEKKTKKKKK